MGGLVLPAPLNKCDYTCALVKEMYLYLYKLLQATTRSRNIAVAKFCHRNLAKGTYLRKFCLCKRGHIARGLRTLMLHEKSLPFFSKVLLQEGISHRATSSSLNLFFS